MENKKVMKKECVNITACGNRIKQEAKKRGYSNQDMADLLHYSSGKQISPFYSGKQQFTKEQIMLISKTFGVRENYLLCIDDWETDTQMIESVNASNLEEYNKILEYLSTLGLDMRPMVCFCGSIRALYWEYWSLEEYLTSQAKQQAKTLIDIPLHPNDPNYNEDLDFELAEKYSETEYICLELRKNPIEEMRKAADLTKKDFINDEEDIYLYCRSWGDECDTINILYKIIFNGEEIGFAEVNDIHQFFCHIDALCKTSIKTVLIDMFSKNVEALFIEK